MTKQEQDKLLEEAKLRYPPGTVFKSVHNNKVSTVDNVEACLKTLYWLTPKLLIVSIKESNYYGGYIYKDGIWAEIISKPEVKPSKDKPKFEVGKWYKVELSGQFNHYIKDKAYLDGGYIHNLNKWDYGISIILSNVTKYELLTDLSEIQQYLPDGHVDKVVKPSLVGRYVKALVNNPQSTNFKQGDYVEIVSATPNSNKYLLKNDWVYTTDNNTASQWQLMPEGFDPNKVEEKSDNFVLPEKWCIKNTLENRPYIEKYRRSINYSPIEINVKYKYQSQNCGASSIIGTEITFEQFKKYVLKEDEVKTTHTKFGDIDIEIVKLPNGFWGIKATKQSPKTELELIPIKKLKTFNN